MLLLILILILLSWNTDTWLLFSIMRGKIESIQLPLEYPKVDVIISEWMGYALLYESMLDSVLHARDRFLKPNGGGITPSPTRMMQALCEPASRFQARVRFWKNAYGVAICS